MSHGLPSVCSKQVVDNFDIIKGSKPINYKNNDQMIKLIFKLKKSKFFSLAASKRSLKIIKKLKWEKVLPELNKFI